MTDETDKVTSMAGAIRNGVADGDSVYIAGFTHLIPFAAGHEVIRQRKRDLHVIRATPDLVVDQMIGAGLVRKATFSWAGNPGVGSLRAFRRAVEDGEPSPVEIEEYTHFGLMSRLAAGARGLPFMPVRTFTGSDLPAYNDNIRVVENPFGPETIYAVPPITPDVAVIHAQRADQLGNAHVWGIQGDIPDAALAADTVILSVEELVSEDVIRSDPNRTAIVGSAVDYVVEERYGAHPSYSQGYYDRDGEMYLAWDEISKRQSSLEDWLTEWVYEVDDRTEYVGKLASARLLELQPGSAYATPIDMGLYR